MQEKDSLKLTKPGSIWTKPVKIKVKMLKDIFNIITDAGFLRLDRVPEDMLNLISGLELKDSIAEKGWLLVSRALTGAIFLLIGENQRDIQKKDIVTDDLDDRLNEVMEKTEIFLGSDFFERPGQLKLLEAIQPILLEFLQLFNFGSNTAENLCNRLPGYFVLALAEEWRRNPEYYAKLEKGLKTPFDRMGKVELNWMAYSAWITKQVDEPIFAESFSLRQVYIPLRAYYFRKNIENEGNVTEQNCKKVAVNLEEELEKWLKEAKKDDAIKVICGGPGYGKSSFLKIFAAKQVEKGRTRVLFIPLHQFKIKDDLDEAICSFARDDGYLPDNPIEENRLLVIFDGLDELAMQGKVLADAAEQFIEEVRYKVGSKNTRELRLQVIISGRDVIIQRIESKFRIPGQVLNILPYCLNKAEIEHYHEPHRLLEGDQRDAWWVKYGKAKGKVYQGLPNKLNKPDLDEITSQPLLNYLVALSYERGKITFSEDTNLNAIYEDLLEEVHKRSYECYGTHRCVEKLEYIDFVRVLEEIAVTSWHGNGRTATVKEIQEHFKENGLERLFDGFRIEAEKGIISLLAAFYFRKSGNNLAGDETFEFTHKSFGEFLAARRIISRVAQICSNLEKKEKCYDEGWDARYCLIQWAKLFGPKEIDKDLYRFINNEMELRVAKIGGDRKKNLQKNLITLINSMLKNGMPMENIETCSTFHEKNRQAINSENALLVMLSCVAGVTRECSKIAWESKTAFGDWISRLQGQRKSKDIFILQHLRFLAAEDAILFSRDFLGANLNNANLRNAVLCYAILVEANLEGADLSESDLSGADLREANLVGANLRRANLRRTNLSGANLRDADLSGNDLTTAIYRIEDLYGAEVKGAILKRN